MGRHLTKEDIMFAFRVHFGLSIHDIRENVYKLGMVYQRGLLAAYLKDMCDFNRENLMLYLNISQYRLYKDANALRSERRIRPGKVKFDKKQLNKLILL